MRCAGRMQGPGRAFSPAADGTQGTEFPAESAECFRPKSTRREGGS